MIKLKKSHSKYEFKEMEIPYTLSNEILSVSSEVEESDRKVGGGGQIAFFWEVLQEVGAFITQLSCTLYFDHTTLVRPVHFLGEVELMKNH